MAPFSDTYDQVRRAMDDARAEQGDRTRSGDGSKWPAWIQTAIAVTLLIATILGAYFSLDKRMSLLEQKLDFVVRQVQK